MTSAAAVDGVDLFWENRIGLDTRESHLASQAEGPPTRKHQARALHLPVPHIEDLSGHGEEFLRREVVVALVAGHAGMLRLVGSYGAAIRGGDLPLEK